jgi:cysteinyl-tRNA synthetase
MDDDFNAPAALAVLQDYTRQVNTLINEGGSQTAGSLAALDQLYRQLGGDVLGIIPDQADTGGGSADREDGLVRLLIDLRAQARSSKDWATADQVRDKLKALGIVLEDRSDGTIWKVE